MNDPLLDIEVDGLTNSIHNTISGDSFDTEVAEVSKTDLKISPKPTDGNLTGRQS
jgi:hypothetical protein